MTNDPRLTPSTHFVECWQELVAPFAVERALCRQRKSKHTSNTVIRAHQLRWEQEDREAAVRDAAKRLGRALP